MRYNVSINARIIIFNGSTTYVFQIKEKVYTHEPIGEYQNKNSNFPVRFYWSK